MKARFFLISTSLVIITITGSFGQDRVFNYTYQSSVLNVGQREIEVWNTYRSGRDGFYRGIDTRLEFEFGICKNLQTAFYLNMSSASEEHFTDYGNGVTDLEISSEMEWSVSSEWKWKWSDPVANTLGSAIYGELTVGDRKIELEGKLILDKKTGRFMHALNIEAEGEWETEVEEKQGPNALVEKEIKNEFESGAELDYGLSYNFNANWNAGIELRCRNAFEGSEWEKSVLYGGPGFSYARGPIWINLTLLPQITGLKHPDDNGSGLLLDGYEKFETRLLFSYVF